MAHCQKFLCMRPEIDQKIDIDGERFSIHTRYVQFEHEEIVSINEGDKLDATQSASCHSTDRCVSKHTTAPSDHISVGVPILAVIEPLDSTRSMHRSFHNP